ncbi:MAG: hypothetical protein HY690_15965 [Chloroflexi bacterium]|nr:hypothetical protein [Chloroflexota bacterium]
MTAAGHAFLTLEQLRHALRERSITDAQIDRALAALSGPDLAGVLQPPTWAEVAHVAVYLHVLFGGIWIPSQFWRLIEEGHPAARAIYWHEFQELESYRLLRVSNPLQVKLGSARYWEAHARASWEEARYWEAWAAAEGEGIPAEAFLREHPIRRELDEIPRLLGGLQATWGIDVGRPSVLVLRRARQFYQAKQLTRGYIERWPSR